MNYTMRQMLAALLLLAPAEAILAPALPAQALSGGALTVTDHSPSAYSHPAANLTEEQAELFALGHQMFHNRWAFFWFENAIFGRGPTSNAQACTTCHDGNGRGMAPGDAHVVKPDGEELDQNITVPFEPAPNVVIRVSLPGTDEHNGPRFHPHYGDQLQVFGVKGVVPAEASFDVTWQEHVVTLEDGTKVTLRSPEITISDLAFGPLGEGAMTGPRRSPPIFGLGLLEAVAQETIDELTMRDKPDGIKGHVNYVWDPESGQTVPGRFGLKANHPSLREQIAVAFFNDIGLSSPIYPDQNCPPVQKACDEQMLFARPEITPKRLAGTEMYLRALAVPARRNLEDPAVQRGEAVFEQARCSVCHVPELRTGDFDAFPQAANQIIRPYTDLLLHDMGEGLADNRPDYLASGRDWRTSPLWGIGLSRAVNSANNFLHDGRARTLEEAILWHGGEAQVSNDAYRKLAKGDRDALIAFLMSL
ncbi:MAG: di-heme oxidoredictase family protein [Burkholderiales bacterium]|jgi:CxxC motif-containing protein (DUF1111 family)